MNLFEKIIMVCEL